SEMKMGSAGSAPFSRPRENDHSFNLKSVILNAKNELEFVFEEDLGLSQRRGTTKTFRVAVETTELRDCSPVEMLLDDKTAQRIQSLSVGKGDDSAQRIAFKYGELYVDQAMQILAKGMVESFDN